MWWFFCLIVFIIIIVRDKPEPRRNGDDVFIPFDNMDQPGDNGEGF